MNDPTQVQIRQHTQNFSTLQVKLNKINSDITLHHLSFGEDQENKPIQPEFIGKYCGSVIDLKKIADSKKSEQIKERKFDLDYDKVINALNSKIETTKANLKVKEETLATIEEKEKALGAKINELIDRKKLNEKYSEAEKNLTN